MFFKMLKNDLKAHKGLNIILFIFIVCSSVISVVATNLMYSVFTGRSNTDRIANVANVYMYCNIGMDNFDDKKAALESWMGDNERIKEGELREYAVCLDDEVCINGRYASDPDMFFRRNFAVTTQPKKIGLLFNDDDRPFAVDTGEIAVSIDFAEYFSLSRGDKIRITSYMGNVYEFTIAEIYKQPSDTDAEEFILADADYKLIRSEFPFRNVTLWLRAVNNSVVKRLTDELYEQNLVRGCSAWGYAKEIDADYTILTVISYFLFAMSVIIILIMLITLRFMMVAAINREEKEIGMMRAIGVDSPRYRWMFASTYVVFAIIGGIAGITVGVPLSEKCRARFCTNMFSTNHRMPIYIAIAVSIGIIILILLFSAIIMRRINRISVIETIHGNGQGERFGKLNRLNIYKSKRMKIPAMLAIGNIVNSFKKYIFLVITYMMAIVILFIAFHLKNSLQSDEYSRNFLLLNYDFMLYLDGEWAEYYYQKGGDRLGAYQVMKEELNSEGIPVDFRCMHVSNAEILMDDRESLVVRFMFGDTNNELIPLRKGGKLPILDNEIIVSYFTAKKEGWKIGDTLTLELEEYDDNNISHHTVQREFIITGFFDKMEEGYPTVIVGEQYTGAVKQGLTITDLTLDAPKSEHPKYIKQMQDRFGEGIVYTMKEEREMGFGYITKYIDALKILLSIIIAFILSLNTLLYTTVDLNRETPSIAMLKCTGFSNKDIRRWQLLRMLLILVIAYIGAVILQKTVVVYIVAKVFENFGVTGFRFVPNPIDKYVIVPCIIFGIVIVALRVCLGQVKSINIWNIREE